MLGMIIAIAAFIAACLALFIMIFCIKKKKNGSRKKWILLALVAVCLVLAFFAVNRYFNWLQYKVIYSLTSSWEGETYTQGEFQDSTDYGVYTLKNISVKDNSYFTRITAADRGKISIYLEDYEDVVLKNLKIQHPDSELAVNYDFDSKIIDTNDYFYLETKGSAMTCYDLWILDTQTQTLYYFHHNI